MVLDMTGAVGFAGVEAKKGIDLAVKEANDGNALGDGSKIEVSIEDAASDPKQAASLAQKVTRDDDVPRGHGRPGQRGHARLRADHAEGQAPDRRARVGRAGRRRDR